MIDIPTALKRVGGDRSLLVDLAQFFVEDAPTLIENFKTSLASGEADEAARAVHSLRGLAANFDGLSLQRTAGDIEQLARQENLEAAASRIGELEQEVAKLLAALKGEGLLK